MDTYIDGATNTSISIPEIVDLIVTKKNRNT